MARTGDAKTVFRAIAQDRALPLHLCVYLEEVMSRSLLINPKFSSTLPLAADKLSNRGKCRLGEHDTVPKLLTQYRVFIASPSGLDEERECFRRNLDRFTTMHAEPVGVTFHPVCWEQTVGGAGRPQELINEDLKECDYAVFVLHDRWGSPPGGAGRYASGVEEEWTLVEELYKANKIRNVALFFKNVDLHQMNDPGIQLQAVLSFKKRIAEEKRYLFRQYATIHEFTEALDGHLAKWLRDHHNVTRVSSVFSRQISLSQAEQQ